MVLGKRLPLVLFTMVVLLAVVVGVVGGVSASPDTAASKKKVAHSLTVVSKDREARVVDLGPRGPSQGDMRVVNAALYNASATRKIGRFDQFCVLTDPADEPDERAQMTQCMFTYTLPGGQISAQGVNSRSELSGLPITGVVPMAGGTGKYSGAQGELRFEARGERVIATFRFVG